MRDLVVYIAGPISRGDIRENLKRACQAGLRLMEADIAVMIPHLSCFAGQVYYGTGCLPEALPDGTFPEDWYAMSLILVRRCDAVLRLPGESKGADLETSEAAISGIPVFHSVSEVIAWVDGKTKERAAG